MKTLIYSLAAAATLAATPAFAGVLSEVTAEKDRPVQIVAAPFQNARGQGPVVNGKEDGTLRPAAIGSVRIAAYPDSERPPFDRGR